MLGNIAIIKATVPATVTATTDETWELFKVPNEVAQGELIRAWLMNGGALTGDGTNYTTLSIYNVTQALAMASRAVDTVTTDNVVADTPWAITVSTTVANKKFVANDRIQARKADTTGGMAITVPACFQGDFWLNGTYD